MAFKNFEDFISNYKVLRSNNEETTWYVVKSEDVVHNGYLHDTYGRYGQQLDEWEAGDYCLANTETDFAIRLERSLRFEFEILEDAVFYMSEDGIFDYDVEITDEELEKINNFVREFIVENTRYTEATYFTYWDGSNWQSIIIDSEFDCGNYWEIETDEEILKALYEAWEDAEFTEYGTGRSAKSKGYDIRVSYYASNPFLYEFSESED